ncbi:MAG: hypothetical protein VW518_10335 [Burkholderiaceae bacterium]
MSDDLVKKLRSQIGDDIQEFYSHEALFRLAADRIEELEVYSNGLVEELRSRTRRLEQERDLALAQVDRLLQLSNSIDDDFENFVAKSTDVDLIEQAISDVLSEGGTYRDAAEYVASAYLAELKGEK